MNVTPSTEAGLWSHQRRALAELRALFRWRRGMPPTPGMVAGTTTLHARDGVPVDRVRRVALVIPGGGGKTRTACAMLDGAVRKMGVNPPPNVAIFCAHLTPLISQASRALDREGLTAHGVMQGNHPRFRPWAPVQVASKDTLLARDRAGKRLAPAPKFIVIDEAHTSMADGYFRLVTELYPESFVIGLTATPWRLDGVGLGRMYDAMVIGATYEELIASGTIVPARAFIPPPPKLEAVRIGRDGDYNEDDLDAAVNTDSTIGDVVNHYRQYGEGRPFVGFALNIAHSKALTAAFRAAGIPCDHVDGTMPDSMLVAAEKRILAGESRGIFNASKLREGWDLPLVSCVILTRPTKSLSLYIQTAVRGDRKALGLDGLPKRDFILIDCAGSVMELSGLPTIDRPWTLDDRDVKEPGAPALLKRCPPPCFAAVPIAAMVCPECGHEFTREAAEPKPIDTAPTGAKLVEFKPEMVRQELLPWSPEDMAQLKKQVKRARQAPLSGFQTSAWEAKPWRASK